MVISSELSCQKCPIKTRGLAEGQGRHSANTALPATFRQYPLSLKHRLPPLFRGTIVCGLIVLRVPLSLASNNIEDRIRSNPRLFGAENKKYHCRKTSIGKVRGAVVQRVRDYRTWSFSFNNSHFDQRHCFTPLLIHETRFNGYVNPPEISPCSQFLFCFVLAHQYLFIERCPKLLFTSSISVFLLLSSSSTYAVYAIVVVDICCCSIVFVIDDCWFLPSSSSIVAPFV